LYFSGENKHVLKIDRIISKFVSGRINTRFQGIIYFYRKICVVITPKNISKGDTIGIVSPAGFIEQPVYENAAKTIRAMGYNVARGRHTTDRHHQFAGNDTVRASDFQQMLDDENISMILCSRGGYGSVRIIDRLDFSKFIQQPKWIAGYSDITVFHAHLFSVFGIESLHSIMPLNFPASGVASPAVAKLFAVASGQTPAYDANPHPLNRNGKSSGKIIGGNLSVLLSLTGSMSDISTEGCVLFIEEVGEALYHLDRMLQTLKRAGKLSCLAGLVVGGLTEMSDSNTGFGKTAEEIVAEAVADFDFPVCFGFPAGHIPENYPLIMGREVTLNISEHAVKLEFL
jgi:muramoyltetrapeptide carboxypeptidase